VLSDLFLFWKWSVFGSDWIKKWWLLQIPGFGWVEVCLVLKKNVLWFDKVRCEVPVCFHGSKWWVKVDLIVRNFLKSSSFFVFQKFSFWRRDENFESLPPSMTFVDVGVEKCRWRRRQQEVKKVSIASWRNGLLVKFKIFYCLWLFKLNWHRTGYGPNLVFCSKLGRFNISLSVKVLFN